ncbi:glutathione S-transferase family protein [Pseudoduganella plicata]|uniref:Glutathione S-transferase n=1 Tax=Pseudoduganella plicata TaxID=321984 RepID=A0A4V1AUD8_9BURK|nr:glutathione S-transferase family protein [Pseudoduganella plicata]QBQ38818.1 glutathione S-transferase family protein [Pseudoduganella plicata]GGY85335.1 glutathione S-transferase [Pseudoduganella plicata]
MTTVTALNNVPGFARGLVRDLRVRWALEEAGQSYEQRLLAHGELAGAGHRALQPFCQVPTYEEDGLALFESGAIVLHIGAASPALLPDDPAERARATTWVFAALNTVEPPIAQLAELDFFHAGEAWVAEARPGVMAAVRRRLDQLAACLGQDDYLEGRFTAGDLLMATVLRNLRQTDLIEERPVLHAYLRRCEGRPAFARALAAQMGGFDDAH